MGAWLFYLLFVAASYSFNVEPLPTAPSSLTLQDYEKQYGGQGKSQPVHIIGATNHWKAQDWTSESLRATCGSKLLNQCNGKNRMRLELATHVKVFNASKQGGSWAGMQPVDIESRNVSTLSSLLDRWEEGPERQADLYLHDASIDILCPALFKDLRVPLYFATDYQVPQTSP